MCYRKTWNEGERYIICCLGILQLRRVGEYFAVKKKLANNSVSDVYKAASFINHEAVWAAIQEKAFGGENQIGINLQKPHLRTRNRDSINLNEFLITSSCCSVAAATPKTHRLYCTLHLWCCSPAGRQSLQHHYSPCLPFLPTQTKPQVLPLNLNPSLDFLLQSSSLPFFLMSVSLHATGCSLNWDFTLESTAHRYPAILHGALQSKTSP